MKAKLSRKHGHRRSTLRSLASSLLLHEKIKTTVPKAKELRRVVDRLVVQAKAGKHREVGKIVKDRAVYRKLFEVLSQRYERRSSGFTRVLRLGLRRRGDGTEMSLIQLV